MASFPIGIKFEPVLSVDKLNAVLDALRNAMGALGKDIKPIDTSALAASFQKIDAAVAASEAKFRAMPAVAEAAVAPFKVTIPAIVKQGLDKTIQEADGFSSKFKDLMSTSLGVLGGGLLLGGISGMVGGFEQLIEKGKQQKEIQEGITAAVKGSGAEESKIIGISQQINDNASELSKKFAISGDSIRQATETYLRFGGTTDNINKKQEIMVGLAERLRKPGQDMNLAFDAAARALTKATDPEIEAQLTKMGIKFQAGATDAERFSVIQEKISGTLVGLKDKADGPLGQMFRAQDAFNKIQKTVGLALIDALAPVATTFANIVGTVMPPVISGLKAILQFTAPLVPVVAAVGAGYLLWQGASNLPSMVANTEKFATTMLQKLVPAMFQSQTAMIANGVAQLDLTATSEADIAAKVQQQLVTAGLTAEEATLASERVASIAITEAANGASDETIAKKIAESLATEGLVTAKITEGAETAGLMAAQLAANGVSEATIAAKLQEEFASLGLGAAEAEAAAAKTAGVAVSLAAVGAAEEEIAAKVASAVATEASTTAVEAGTLANEAFNASFLANPVFLVIAGLVALGAAAYAAYQYFAPFKAWADEVWGRVKPILEKIGDAFVSLGKFIFEIWNTWFTVISTPFKVLWSLVSGLFSLFSSGAKDSGDSLGTLGTVLDWLNTGVNVLKATMEGLVEIAKGVSAAVSKLVKFDFSGAWDSLVSSADAAKTAAVRSLQDSQVQDAAKAMGDTLGKGVTEGAGAAKLDPTELLAQFTEVSDKIKVLKDKAAAQGGFLNNSDKATLEQLTAEAQTASNKIGEIAPQAVAAVHSQVDAAGKITQVYDLNIAKAQEFADAQKKAADDALVAKQKKYSDSLTVTANLYDAQKLKLEDMRKAYDAALASGDTKKIDAAKEAFDKQAESAKKSGDAMTKGFEDGAAAGLVTQSTIEAVAKAQGVTADQAKQNILAKNFDEAAKSGKLTAAAATELGDKLGVASDIAKKSALTSELKMAAEQGTGSKAVIADLAKQFGVTATEAHKIYDEQVRVTGEIKLSKEAAMSLGDAYTAANDKQKASADANRKTYDALKSELNDINARLAGPADKQLVSDKARKAEIQQQIALLKDQTLELNAHLRTAAEIDKKAGEDLGFGEAKKKQTKDVFNNLQSTYEVTKKQNDEQEKNNKLSKDLEVLGKGRSANDFDNLDTLGKQLLLRQANVAAADKLFNTVKNESGVAVSIPIDISAKFDPKKRQEDITKGLELVNNAIAGVLETKKAIADIQVKLNLSEDQKREFELKLQLKPIEQRIRTSTDLNQIADDQQQIADIYTTSAAEITKKRQSEQSLLNLTINAADREAIEKRIKELSTLEDKAITDSEKAQKDASNSRLEIIKLEEDSKLKLIKRTSDIQASFIDSFSNAVSTHATSEITTAKEAEIARIEELNKAGLINQATANRLKADEEQKSADQLFAMQQVAVGRKLEAERQAAIAELEIRQSALQKTLDEENNRKDTQAAAKTQAALSEVSKVLAEKSSTINFLATEMQTNLTDTLNNLFTGNNEDAKKGMKGTLAMIAGYLEKLASAAILELVFSPATIASMAAAGPLAVLELAAVTGLINAGVHTLLNPILASLLSFSTGGIVTQPTLAIVGDRANTSGRDNTELILGSDQMQAALQMALVQYDSRLAAEVRMLREDMRNQPVVVVIDGQEMLTAVRTAEYAQTRRIQTG